MKSDLDNSLFKNILKLISGEGIGRIIGFIAAPFITRLYTPADFGLLAVFTSYVPCVIHSVRLDIRSPFHYIPMKKSVLIHWRHVSLCLSSILYSSA